MSQTPQQALDVVAFWKEAGPERWFKKDAAFDDEFRSRFLDLHEAAARGELSSWSATPEGSLALLLLLDQFPRNCFRGSPRAFWTDPLARAIASKAVQRGHDLAVDPALRNFFYLPFTHSEWLPDQERCVALACVIGGEAERYARMHHDLIERFGRFPHRNPVVGRHTTPEEQAYLDGGGFAG